MKFTRFISAVLFVAGWAAFSAGQTVETKEGIRFVHNGKGGLWGKKPKIKLIPARQLGDIDIEDEAFAFNMPSDIALDTAGNIYVLDGQNCRIQKFDKDFKYAATIGRRGQGPGEFNRPSCLEIDAQGRIYVSERLEGRISVLAPEGTYIRDIDSSSGGSDDFKLLPSGSLISGPSTMLGYRGESAGGQDSPRSGKLIRIFDSDGRLLREMGDPAKQNDEFLDMMINRVKFAPDDSGHVYIAFPYQNRIEKFDPDGRLEWRADRELNYKLEVQDRGKLEQSGSRVSIAMPKMNSCMVDMAADAKGRIWVVTLDRQLRDEEKVSVSNLSYDGVSTSKIQGNQDLRTTDAYKIEVFGPDGVLLGEIPLAMFVDGIFIFGDRLFLLDKLRGVSFHEFKIVE